MCHSFVRVHCHVSLRQLIVLTSKIRCSFTQDRKPEKYPVEDLHYTTKGTVVNRGCIGKPRVTKAICFYVRKNTLQIKMNLNQFLKSFIKGNFVRGQNKDCEICSNLFVCMYVCMTDWHKNKKKVNVGYFSKLERMYDIWQWQYSEKWPFFLCQISLPCSLLKY